MQANQPLADGASLEEFRILHVLASGGFSYVYLAHDRDEMPVALKEYLPASLALRQGPGAALSVSEAARPTFAEGLRCFFEEARALAGVRHPNVVRVFNFFRANGTAYMVMRYERGRTLQEHIERARAPLRESWLRATFASLLNGLREVHAGKLLHLDLKPGNIFVRNDGTPVLIDFGAVRQALAAERQGAPQVHTPGFASPEHLGRRDRLGPWSDIYSVGATLYACVTGEAPPPAAERAVKDRLPSLCGKWKAKASAELLETIDWCLRLDPLERPQSVLALQKALGGAAAPAAQRGDPAAEARSPGGLRVAMG
jgi:hypothetical protein